jgi:hypothetical protein
MTARTSIAFYAEAGAEGLEFFYDIGHDGHAMFARGRLLGHAYYQRHDFSPVDV